MTLYQDRTRSRARLFLRPSLSTRGFRSTIILLVWLAAFCLASIFLALFILQKGETSLPVYHSMRHIMAGAPAAIQPRALAPAVYPSTTPQ
jgi:hypothetical protein